MKTVSQFPVSQIDWSFFRIEIERKTMWQLTESQNQSFLFLILGGTRTFIINSVFFFLINCQIDCRCYVVDWFEAEKRKDCWAKCTLLKTLKYLCVLYTLSTRTTKIHLEAHSWIEAKNLFSSFLTWTNWNYLYKIDGTRHIYNINML